MSNDLSLTIHSTSQNSMQRINKAVANIRKNSKINDLIIKNLGFTGEFMAQAGGARALVAEVLDKNLCVVCGACVSLCPYFKIWQGNVTQVHDCDLETGRCYDYCPRTSQELEVTPQEALGPAKRIILGRATDPAIAEQSKTPGVVIALLDLALKEGLIDAAVLGWKDENRKNRARVSRSREELLQSAASEYLSTFNLETLNAERWQKKESIGVAGIPCQISALDLMKKSTLPESIAAENLALLIGLFCYKTSPIDTAYMEGVEKESSSIPQGCNLCMDMSSEVADISVGIVKGLKDWAMIIARNDLGLKLLQRAEESGVIECRAMDEDKHTMLKEIDTAKKKRAADLTNKIEK